MHLSSCIYLEAEIQYSQSGLWRHLWVLCMLVYANVRLFPTFLSYMCSKTNFFIKLRILVRKKKGNYYQLTSTNLQPEQIFQCMDHGVASV